MQYTPEPEETIKRISEADSFEELYTTLDRMGEVEGSYKKYTAEYLKQKIEDLRKTMEILKKGGTNKMNPDILRVITKAEGLRGKVKELLEK